MSALDYRRIQLIVCSGIGISTFLSDDRNTVLVSASDIVEQLSMNIDDLESIEGVEEYVAYNSIGEKSVHLCIEHMNINEFLWMNDCKDVFAYDLHEFRKYLSYEVMSFWQRFKYSAASLSVRDAVNVIDVKTSEYHTTLGLPPGRIYQMAIESLGYDRMPIKGNLTTEELSFIAFAELLYASVAASEQANGHSVGESMRLSDMRLEKPLRELGNIARGIGGI